MSEFFKGIDKVKYEGPDSTNPLAFRYYNKDEIVLGKRMEDQPALRGGLLAFTFAWDSRRPLRPGRTFDRPWFERSGHGSCPHESRCGL